MTISSFSSSLDRKTKIIATLGPASESKAVLLDMLSAGVDAIRLNASHGADPQDIQQKTALIRACAKQTHKHVAIFLDLQGPKIRVGKFKDNKTVLQAGATFVLTTDPVLGDSTRASVTYTGFANDVQPGEVLFVDDGKIELRVESKKGSEVVCSVIRGGLISNSKGINLPDTVITLSALTDKDKQDVKVAVDNQLDYVALSFVSSGEDIRELRQLLDTLGGTSIGILAKIERQKAVDNLYDIVAQSDGVMVARGDLGVEIGLSHVPKVQKMIIRAANQHLKPVLVATQMLESMIQSETATRAEVSDVANAIYDRCDAVMLSGETAMGINPANVIRTMVSICEATDRHMAELKRERGPKHISFATNTVATSCCKAADWVASENDAKIIMAFTSSGNTPLIASKLNPSIPIIAPTDSDGICQKMSLYRGVTPILLHKKYEHIHRWTDMIHLAIKDAKSLGIVGYGDKVVVIAGIPIGQSGINSIRVVTVH